MEGREAEASSSACFLVFVAAEDAPALFAARVGCHWGERGGAGGECLAVNGGAVAAGAGAGS